MIQFRRLSLSTSIRVRGVLALCAACAMFAGVIGTTQASKLSLYRTLNTDGKTFNERLNAVTESVGHYSADRNKAPLVKAIDRSIAFDQTFSRALRAESTPDKYGKEARAEALDAIVEGTATVKRAASQLNTGWVLQRPASLRSPRA